MNIERLKFAWARGARIKVPVYKGWTTDKIICWETIDNASAANELTCTGACIHPDDAHLEYGPVSTAFRDMALYVDTADLPEIVELFIDLAGSNWVIAPDYYVVDPEGSEYSMFIDFCRLFFAEYLADQGL